MLLFSKFVVEIRKRQKDQKQALMFAKLDADKISVEECQGILKGQRAREQK